MAEYREVELMTTSRLVSTAIPLFNPLFHPLCIERGTEMLPLWPSFFYPPLNTFDIPRAGGILKLTIISNFVSTAQAVL